MLVVLWFGRGLNVGFVVEVVVVVVVWFVVVVVVVGVVMDWFAVSF